MSSSICEATACGFERQPGELTNALNDLIARSTGPSVCCVKEATPLLPPTNQHEGVADTFVQLFLLHARGLMVLPPPNQSEMRTGTLERAPAA
jgi:hypothetical protein